MRRILILAIAVFLLTASLASAQKKYSASEARRHVGEYATIVGMVYQVFKLSKGTIFLDIGGKNPNNPFTGVINARDAGKFSDIQQCRRKIVEITGRILKYRDRTAEIILTDPAQIKIEATDSRKYKP